MTFLDSNVFVYFADGRDSAKRLVARAIIADAIGNPNFLISTQVLNEFASVALKKLSMTEDDVRGYVEEFMHIRTIGQRTEWTTRALEIKKACGLQFYDSLLIAAAEANDCDEMMSEDLTDGRTYCGVKIVNPFV